MKLSELIEIIGNIKNSYQPIVKDEYTIQRMKRDEEYDTYYNLYLITNTNTEQKAEIKIDYNFHYGLQIDRGVEKERARLTRIGLINDLKDNEEEDAEPQKLMQEAKELLLKKSVAPKDNVNHPSHYNQGKIECIEAIESATIGKSGIEAVCVANVIKYLWRYEEKGGRESVEKAMWYLQKLLEKLEVKND